MNTSIFSLFESLHKHVGEIFMLAAVASNACVLYINRRGMHCEPRNTQKELYV